MISKDKKYSNQNSTRKQFYQLKLSAIQHAPSNMQLTSISLSPLVFLTIFLLFRQMQTSKSFITSLKLICGRVSDKSNGQERKPFG